MYILNGICYRVLLYSYSTWYSLLLCTIVDTVEQALLHFGLFIAQCVSLDISARCCDRSQVVYRLQCCADCNCQTVNCFDRRCSVRLDQPIQLI